METVDSLIVKLQAIQKEGHGSCHVELDDRHGDAPFSIGAIVTSQPDEGWWPNEDITIIICNNT